MKNILVAVDFSDVTDRILMRVAELAKATAARVWVMHAVTDTSFISGAGEVPVPWTVTDEDLPKHFPSEHGKLRELVATLQDMGIEAQHLLVSGPAVDRVLDLADEKNADMIVLGSHGHGALYKLLVGTISEGVLRRSHRPVLLVPSQPKEARAQADETHTSTPLATPY